MHGKIRNLRAETGIDVSLFKFGASKEGYWDELKLTISLSTMITHITQFSKINVRSVIFTLRNKISK